MCVDSKPPENQTETSQFDDLESELGSETFQPKKPGIVRSIFGLKAGVLSGW